MKCMFLIFNFKKILRFISYIYVNCLVQGNDNYTGIAAKDTANALRVLAKSVRGVAATTNDRQLQENLLEHARDVMDKSANLIDEAKKAVNNPQNPENQTRLAQVVDQCNAVPLNYL